MNTHDVKVELENNNIDPRAYSINGLTAPPHDEQYVLSNTNNLWVIYFEERGERTYEMFYLTENEACEHFLTRILKDTTTRK